MFSNYSGFFGHILEVYIYIQNHDIIRTRDIFSILAYSEIEAYSELCQTSTTERFAKMVNGYNYLRKLRLFSQYQVLLVSGTPKRISYFLFYQLSLLKNITYSLFYQLSLLNSICSYFYY